MDSVCNTLPDGRRALPNASPPQFYDLLFVIRALLLFCFSSDTTSSEPEPRTQAAAHLSTTTLRSRLNQRR